jgi:hypothetical protein
MHAFHPARECYGRNIPASMREGRGRTILTTSKLDLPGVQISDSARETIVMRHRAKQRERNQKSQEAGAAGHGHAPNMSSLTQPVALRATTVAKAIAPANVTNPFL